MSNHYLSFSQENHRTGRIIQQTNYIPHNTFQPPPPNKYIPTSNYYFSNRVDNADNIELVGNSRPNVPDPYAKQQHNVPQPNVQTNIQNLQSFTPIRQNNNHQQSNINPSPREVSETDLVLLSAIEKLTYRVDFLEQRLRKAEQLILYLADGGNPNKEPDCPGNFTKIGDTCYFFGQDRGLNWKSASAMCKSYGGQLAELDPASKQKEVIIKLLNDFNIRGHDFWVGGLNPGLIWIWINSGKPVNPKVDLKNMIGNRKSRIIVDFSEIPLESAANFTTEITSTETSATEATQLSTELTEEARKRVEKSTPVTPKIVNKPTKPARPAAAQQSSPKPTTTNDGFEIKGSGRCLRLSYNPSTHSYEYTGVDCSHRTNYLCELQDHTLENEISRVSKKLEL